ncbi:MAG: hypothetical protein WC498_01535 [Candidatus Saccharimonadales bacterium]
MAEVGSDSLQFSQPPLTSHGYDIACPTTGQPCSRMIELVRLHVEHDDPELVPAERAIEDERLLKVALRGANIQGRNCPGETEDGRCPTIIDQGLAQKLAAKGFWRVTRALRGNN